MTPRRVMPRKRFRGASAHGLALDPRALDIFFDADGAKPVENSDDGIALVHISGPLEHHRSWCWDNYDDITTRLEAAFADDDTKVVVMCIDSPGGDAAGATEAHRKIHALKKRFGKPIYAYANEQMCSAAYELGCAADEVWLPSTATAGSVGVIASVMDRTKANKRAGIEVALITTGERKGDGDPNKPLTDDVRDALQGRVDHLGRIFFKAVARSRGMTPAAVAALQAGVFIGTEAVKSGLADGVIGWDAFLAMVRDAHELAAPEAAEPESAPAGRRSGGKRQESTMAKKLLQATAALEAAKAALKAAKTDKDREKAISAISAASIDVATAKLAATSSKTTAKSRKAKYEEEEDEEAEDEEDDAEDEESEDEESEDEEDEADDDDSDDDDDDDSDDEEEDDEEEDDEDSKSKSKKSKSKKSDKSKSKSKSKSKAKAADDDDDDKGKSKSKSRAASAISPQQASRLFAACQGLTGKTDLGEVCGALEATRSKLASADRVSRDVAQMKRNQRRERVNGMLAKARAERKIAPGQIASLREQGMRDPKWLKGYLATTPATVRSVDEEFEPRAGTDGEPEGEQTLDMQGLNSDQQKILRTAAHSAGVSLEDQTKAVAARLKAKGAGRAPRS